MPPKRDRAEAFFSPSKANKKARAISSADAEKALESEVMKKMLTEQAITFQSLGAYASDLMGRDITEMNPKAILKTIMFEAWIDTEGRITSNDEDLTVIWKDIKRFNNAQSVAMVNGMTPDIDEIDIGEVRATSGDELVKEINLKLKVIESTSNKLIKNLIQTKEKINENEQKLIRADLEKEHLKLLGHDLNLEDCKKTNAWDISNFARNELIKNYATKHPEVANKNCTRGKEIARNTASSPG